MSADFDPEKTPPSSVHVYTSQTKDTLDMKVCYPFYQDVLSRIGTSEQHPCWFSSSCRQVTFGLQVRVNELLLATSCRTHEHEVPMPKIWAFGVDEQMKPTGKVGYEGVRRSLPPRLWPSSNTIFMLKD